MSGIRPICFLGVVVALLVMGGCTRDLELPAIEADHKIVLIGELSAGDSVYLRAGQSLPVTSRAPMSFGLLNDLQIRISNEADTFQLTSYVDALAGSLYTLPFVSSKEILHGRSYVVTAIHPTLGTVTARVAIPASVNAIVADTASGMYNQNRTLKVRVRIDDPAQTEDYYVLECLKQAMTLQGSFLYNGVWMDVRDNMELYNSLNSAGGLTVKYDTIVYERYYRMPLYTTDRNSENAITDGVNDAQHRILIRDSRFNGSTYETDVYIQVSNPAESAKGKLHFYVKSVSADYFRFLRTYEQYSGGSAFNTFLQPQKSESNVAGGGGFVGGVAAARYTYMVDTLEY
jgi:hypothetical protein